jgi:hypothetical protein
MSETQNLFIEQSLKFEATIISENRLTVPLNGCKFGILNLQTITAPLSQEEHELVIMVDCSGSMSDECSDGRNKMQHIIHTITNIILYFKENPVIKAYLTIHSFDDKITEIISRSVITNDNFDSMIEKINKIVPRSSTNIELALTNVKEIITSLDSSHNICHIFMTDGEATSGKRHSEFLKELVDASIKNIFVGFGISHDSGLLHSLSYNKNSEYYFIDKLENSGLIYGEIIHNIVYKLLSNVVVSIENGLIYNYKENEWVESLYIGEIVSEKNKIYNVISCDPENCFAHLTGNTSEDAFDYLLKGQEIDADLTKYIYRQRTLHHLSMVEEFLKNKINHKYNAFKFAAVRNKETITKSEKWMKENLFAFLEEMKKYMKDNNLMDDIFIKNLCDDIYISYKTIGTRFASMFNISRRTSQGAQRCYSASQIPVVPPIPKLVRNNPHINMHLFDLDDEEKEDEEEKKEEDEEKEDDDEHILSDFQNTPYLSQSSSRLMREISCKKYFK